MLERFQVPTYEMKGETTDEEDEVFRCQFCGYEGKGWLNGGCTCPKCGKDYDWLLAQDSEE